MGMAFFISSLRNKSIVKIGYGISIFLLTGIIGMVGLVPFILIISSIVILIGNKNCVSEDVN